MKTKENGEKIYKALNAWLRNSKSILAFMKKEIKDTKGERAAGKCLESSWTVFNSIFMNNMRPSHTLKGRTFFSITFAKTFVIQITWNSILYHWHASPAINYGKLLLLFFFLIFPTPTFFSFFFWFAPDDSLRENNKTPGAASLSDESILRIFYNFSSFTFKMLKSR